ncbi:MAG: hypothetical protein FJ211_04190 [Ignavibacteria bacterium]|nr:hypothetical protein [Ignavibacteria bacterium]
MTRTRLRILLVMTILSSGGPTLFSQNKLPLSVVRQIDSALSIIGMRSSDLAMPHDLLDTDPFRTATIDDIFRKPYNALDLSQEIANQSLSPDRSTIQPLARMFSPILGLGRFEPSYIDNLPESDAVLARLGISKSRIEQLNIASTIVFLRNAGILIQATDAVKKSNRGGSQDIANVRLLDSMWRMSSSSESLSVWQAHEEEQAAFNAAQKLYAPIKPQMLGTILGIGTSLHDDLVKISRDFLNARDVLIDSVRSFAFDTPYGRIAIGGAGDDIYQGSYIMIIDVGGNDVYQLEHEPLANYINRPVRIIMDLDGNDTYTGGDYSLGAGVMGVGVLIDQSGDDRYYAESYSLGSGLMGMGIVHDMDGNDIYHGHVNTQGSGIVGIGMLIDDNGSDVYRSHAQAQAFAGVGGIGILSDARGNDQYIAASPYTDVLRYDNHQITFSQGAALGSRPHASGGIAVLVDGSGSDTYISDIYGQGTGYWFGIGSLIDRGGDDRYIAYQYAQGSGVHFATGYLQDSQGDDVYTSHGVSQGCGHDIAYGFLFDESGNDSYHCESLSLGAGNANAVSIFVDVQGDDLYSTRDTTNTLGFSDYRRGYGMIGLFVDAQGNDRYSNSSGNQTTMSKSTYATFLDYTDSLVINQQTVPSKASPAMLELPNSADSLFLIASASHLRFQPNVEPARKKLVQLGTSIIPLLESKLSTQMPRERLTVESAAKQLFSTDPDSTVAMLQRGLEQRSVAAVGTAATIITSTKISLLSEALIKLATDNDWRKRRIAAYTLGELRDTSSVQKIAFLANDTVVYVRARAAFALAATTRDPLATVGMLLQDQHQIVRNSTIEGLNRGKRRSVKEISDYLNTVADELVFRSNIRLLLNAGTTKADVKLWKSWVKKQPDTRFSALRTLARSVHSSFRSELLAPRTTAKKGKRKKA